MVYTRLLFNNIKEFTPNFFKTIPYSQTVKPVLGRKAQVAWKMTKDPKTIRATLFFKRYVINNSVNYQIFLFLLTFGITSVFFYPSLWAYQANNRHRQLDAAIAKEKAYQHKKALEDEEEGEDEEGEEGEAEEGEETEEKEAKEEGEETEEKGAKEDGEETEEKGAKEDTDETESKDNKEDSEEGQDVEKEETSQDKKEGDDNDGEAENEKKGGDEDEEE